MAKAKIKIIFRRFIALYFNPLVEFVYRIKFKFISFGKPPIIILTPGKVGSSSIYKTLKSEFKNPVFHIHRLSAGGVEHSIMQHLNSDRKSRPLHLIVAKLLREKLKAYDGDLYIITSIREPISRAVSAFFQNTDFYKNEIEKAGLNIDQDKAKKLLSEKLDASITDKLENWFEEEIKRNFNIDVFEEPFNTSNNYLIKRKDDISYLLLKMEALDETFPIAIKDFLDLPSTLKLKNTNIGSEKHYSKAYRNIKKDISINTKDLEKIIKSKFFKKFYPNSTELVKQKWGDT
ncbi:putative capsular polysaccharide synthesis family protein [Aliifodinibius sp. S!AR15-10]|uniref:putative capsular polysaccharide synthesis family protein n=1 Tax=Aliifodinibius sp. S!AR15-10 TaxID=2950437 RepID=UPI0028618D8A|nr:putative capsular polysaccharide synthesis family protein [Aliifodinibius sp. S!AR15-10]MDR8393373.1 putative capsular polysaccharide synthesis family protein [Aliifodinibius sp. S!AR15-10]